jgi:hypothetical protein
MFYCLCKDKNFIRNCQIFCGLFYGDFWGRWIQENSNRNWLMRIDIYISDPGGVPPTHLVSIKNPDESGSL